MVLFFLFFIEYPDIIKVPMDSIFVAEAEDRAYFYNLDDGIWSIDFSGKILDKGGRQGPGPGEYERPAGFSYFDGKLYVSDRRKHKVIIYNKDLSFFKEHHVDGFTGTLLATAEGLFIVQPSAKENTVLSKYDYEMKLAARFCEPLKSHHHKLNGQQGGELFLIDNHVYFSPIFRPTLFEFDLNGKLIKEHRFPGLKEDFLIDVPGEKEPEKTKMLRTVIYQKNKLFSALIEGNDLLAFFCFNTNTKKWEREGLKSPGQRIGSKYYHGIKENDHTLFVVESKIDSKNRKLLNE